MAIFHTFIFTLLWTKIFANGSTTPNPKMPFFMSSPNKLNIVLVGRNIKLEWTFKLHSHNDLSRIVIFGYYSKAKRVIAYTKNITTGNLTYNPFYMARYNGSCKISYNRNGIGKASINIRNVQFNNTYDYGISLQMKKDHLPSVENSVAVKVVDLVLGTTRKDTRVVRSWLGQKLVLTCDVIYRNRPLFKWYKKSSIRPRNVFLQKNTRTLIIEKVNNTDFGEYMCEAKTNMITVQQKIKVERLGYAGSPRKVERRYYPGSKSYAVYWEQPSTRDGHWVTKYVLEEWDTDKKIWVKRKNITTLHITITRIEKTTKYRVCSANEIGYSEKSCSKPVVLRKTEEYSTVVQTPDSPTEITEFLRVTQITPDARGKSSQILTSHCLVLLIAFLPCVFLRYD